MHKHPLFTSHNIKLDNGKYTKHFHNDDDILYWSKSIKNVLDLIYPNKTEISLIDLGCLEGGYSVEFARMGFQVTGMEVRKSNFSCCEYVKNNCDLPNLKFVNDNVQNIQNYEDFDIAFCSGLLYHLHNPKEFLQKLSPKVNKVLVLQTHFSLEELDPDNFFGKFLSNDCSINEGLLGRWIYDRPDGISETENDEHCRWASYDEAKSFWIDKNHLIQLIKDLGFDIVLEQYDHFDEQVTTKKSSQCQVDFTSNSISEYLKVEYPRYLRSTFYGIKV